MRKLSITILLFVALTFLFGCSKQISETAYKELLDDLERMGFSISTEDVGKDLLQGQRKWLTINKTLERMSIYLYENNYEMEKDASYLSHDGFSYDSGREAVEISWFSDPHFFKKDNMIVLYVGEHLEIINALEELLGPQFAGLNKKANDTPTIPENVPEGIEYLYDFHFSDRYGDRITEDFSLVFPNKVGPINDTLFIFQEYLNEMDMDKEFLNDGDGMVPYTYKRYWYNLDIGDLMVGTHYYQPDDLEFISYLWSDIVGVKTSRNIGVANTEKELLLAYTDDLYYIDKAEAISGSDGLSVIGIIGYNEGNLEELDEKYDFDYAYMWQPFTPETNEIRDITFYIEDSSIIAIEIIDPFELRHVYGYDRDAGLQYTEEGRGN